MLAYDKQLEKDVAAFDYLHLFIQQAWSVLETNTPYVEGKHIEAICKHLQAVEQGQIKRLLINMPPRHMKSTIVSVMWPVWMWLHDPSLRFLCSSYALSLAIRDNRKTRLLMQSQWYQSRYGSIFQFSGDQNVKGRFENDRRGYRLAVSVGSSATGEGGDILLIDDPHNIDEKESDIKREGVLDWFDTTWSTRLNNQQTGALVVVGQRIHEQDLSGHILEQGGWEHLNLPAEYESARPCYTRIWHDWRTHDGDLLWEERFPKAVLDEQRHKLGSLGYAALYQQTPVPSSGGQFKKQWFRYADETPEAYLLEYTRGLRSVLKSDCWRFATLDLAISSKQTADYTVFAMWDVTPHNDLILIDLVRAHLDNPEQMRQLRVLYQRYRPEYFRIERVGYQLALIQQALSEGIPCREYNPTRDKVSRSTTAAVWMENEKLFFKKTLSELPTIETELLQFPRGAHDDIVDNCSMAADEVCSGRIPLSDGYDVPPSVQPASSDGLIPITEPIHPVYREGYAPAQVAAKPVDDFEYAKKHGYFDDW